MTGIFTISLDFELHWGGFEKWKIQVGGKDSTVMRGNYNQYFLNTRAAIPKMLQLFEQYQIHVTWAGVGLLMHKNKTELLQALPALQPSYFNNALSAFQYINNTGIGEDEATDPFHYAHDLVQEIINTPHQELGSHTFSHFYCNEAGQSIEQFRADLQAAQHSAQRFKKKLTSLVFPRNQFNDQYLKVCFEEGFTAVRSNPADWFWHIESTQHEGAWKRLNRGLDAYFPIGKKNVFALSALKIREGFPICIPASRLLRPYNPAEVFLNRLKINRIKSEMENAASNNEVYHLWWHPHNFGNHPAQSLEALEEILKGFQHCAKQFAMESMNMNELTNAAYSIHGKNKAA